MRIAIYGNHHQAAHLDALVGLLRLLCDNGVELVVDKVFMDYLSATCPDPPVECSVVARGAGFSADLALSFGGDGTFLRTAQWVGDSEIPILGINTGHLGYLADVGIGEASAIVGNIVGMRFNIEPRALLRVDLPEGCQRQGFWPYALNEVAVLKKDTASMISARAAINGKELTAYLGDGLIVSTPTGSTGYNLSVGGPIVAPGAPVWVLSPVAAHSLTMRPLVLTDTGRLTICTTSRADSYLLSLDGRSVSLPSGSEVAVSRAPFVVNVARYPGHHFTETLRSKLYWGMSPR